MTGLIGSLLITQALIICTNIRFQYMLIGLGMRRAIFDQFVVELNSEVELSANPPGTSRTGEAFSSAFLALDSSMPDPEGSNDFIFDILPERSTTKPISAKLLNGISECCQTCTSSLCKSAASVPLALHFGYTG